MLECKASFVKEEINSLVSYLMILFKRNWNHPKHIMASFWSENQLVRTKKKKTLQESSWFGEPKCKLVSKVVHFFCFLFCFKLKWNTYYGLSTLLKAHQFLHFLTNSKVDMINSMDLHKVLLEGVHFQPFPSAWNGVELEK